MVGEIKKEHTLQAIPCSSFMQRSLVSEVRVLSESEVVKNEDYVSVLFSEVIIEELDNAGVGRAFVYGDSLQ